MSGQGNPSIHLRVITSRRLLVEADTDGISLPTLEGYIGILPGHRPLVIGLGRGTLSYRIGGEEERFSVQGGQAQVLPEEVVVLTELSEDETVEPSSE